MICADWIVRPGSSPGSEALEDKPGGVAEDAIVGDQWDAQPNRSRCDPAVCVMVPLCECVTGPLAVCSQIGVDPHELRSRMNDLDLGELGIDAFEAVLAPATEQRAEANLGGGLERNELDSADQYWLGGASERRVREQSGAVDVGVDDDRPAVVRCQRQELIASRKASASSGLRSSITCSP